MSTPSGPLRKQLGPAKKRLTTRLTEVKEAIANEDIGGLKNLRPKFNANLTYFNNVVEKLQGITASNEDEEKLIEAELEKCIEIQMDSCEWVDMMNERINNPTDDNKTSALMKMKEEEKVERELENLKLEGDVKRAQLASLKNASTVVGVQGTTEQSNKRVKLPRLELPEFEGDILNWTAFWDSYQSTIHLNAEISKVD